MGIIRRTLFYILQGYQVPEGWTVTYGIKETHETDGYFTDKGTFNPDRWDESTIADTQFKYIPFGGGKRACAGKDLARIMMKIFALELVQTCHWKLANDTTQFVNFPLPYPTDNLPLVLSKRV